MTKQKTPFNKHDLLDNSLELGTYSTLIENITAISPAPIRGFVPRIDRIQISLRNEVETFRYLKDSLASKFKPLNIKRDKNRLIWGYSSEDSLIQLMSGTGRYNWLILYAPSVDMQTAISSIISPLMGLNVDSYTYINLQQVEFAYDFYPCDGADLDDILRAVRGNIYFRRSRQESYNLYKGTHYQALGGNIRRGSAGLRMYLKKDLPSYNLFASESDVKFLRIEIQLNSSGLKTRGINLESLPLTPEVIDPMQLLSFRDQLSDEKIYMLSNFLARKRLPNPKKVKHKARLAFMRNYFARKLIADIIPEDSKERYIFGSNDLRLSDMPVAEQIENYKKVKEEWGLSYDHTKVFPVIKK